MKPSYAEVATILNEPGITWKIRRALLRDLGLDDDDVKRLVPQPDGEFHPSDY